MCTCIHIACMYTQHQISYNTHHSGELQQARRTDSEYNGNYSSESHSSSDRQEEFLKESTLLKQAEAEGHNCGRGLYVCICMCMCVYMYVYDRHGEFLNESTLLEQAEAEGHDRGRGLYACMYVYECMNVCISMCVCFKTIAHTYTQDSPMCLGTRVQSYHPPTHPPTQIHTYIHHLHIPGPGSGSRRDCGTA
jgi:hypothetical protein